MVELLTKLFVPAVRPELVARPGLLQRLDAGLNRALTLVSAPAGFGKTTLLAQWLADLPRPRGATAWLSLDAGDNDPARFVSYLLAALQRANPTLGPAPPSPFVAPDALLAGLVNDLATMPQDQRPVLILDDYHAIHNLAVHQILGFLVQHLPAHLVIATREDPPLPLGRLRAMGQVTEIRQADLRLDAGEVAQFMARVADLQLSAREATAIHQRTEGWIAGLHLLALALRGRDDVPAVIQSFTGSHRYVLDYLMEEVFERQPPDLHEFLVRTSILERMCGPLCEAVLGQAGSRAQAILEHLDRANLFVVPLDAGRQWYRYHHLFADLLRHRLEMEAPADILPLHRRASAWHAANDLPAGAVRHALAAHDWEQAGRLIASGLSGSLLQRGELATLLGWFQALPHEVIHADARLSLEASWPLILTEQLAAAEPFLARAEELATARDDMALLGEVAVARAHIARTRGEHHLAMELAERALALLPADHLSGRSVVAVNLGLAYWFLGRLDDAERTLAEAERAGRGSGNHYARYTALVFMNRIRIARGCLRQAATACREMIDQGGQLPPVAMAHYDLARLLYEWNELPAAVDHVQRGLELSRHAGAVELRAAGHGLLALLHQAMGQPAAATLALRRAAELLDQPGISPGTRLYNLGCQILVGLVLEDDLDASRLPQPPEQDAVGAGSMPAAGSLGDALFLALARGRLLLARGERAAAARHLARLYDQAAAAGWLSVMVQARALQALAAPTDVQARALILDALALAEPEGYLRTFLDGGPAMRDLLTTLPLRPAPPYAPAILAAFSGQPAAGARSGSPTPAATAQPPSPLPEPLTARELEILHLLAQGHTNQEMALALVVSTNTVKTHLKHIYGKLDVTSRRQAIARARCLGLL